jgi:hypothetical protein
VPSIFIPYVGQSHHHSTSRWLLATRTVAPPTGVGCCLFAGCCLLAQRGAPQQSCEPPTLESSPLVCSDGGVESSIGGGVGRDRRPPPSTNGPQLARGARSMLGRPAPLPPSTFSRPAPLPHGCRATESCRTTPSPSPGSEEEVGTRGGYIHASLAPEEFVTPCVFNQVLTSANYPLNQVNTQ